MKIVYTGEMDKRLCKEVIGATIEKLVTEDENVVYLDADLMSCCGTLKWAKQNPERAIDCGIAESNMAGVAAGLAVAGYRPIIHSFGPFASRRCYDQIFLSGGYGKNDVTVIGTDPGVTAAMNGGTHMPFEDVALYNVLPGSTVIDVSDPTCLESVLKQCVYRPGIKYIRVGRKQLARVYEEGSELPIGKAVTLREGDDAVIFAAGIMLHEAASWWRKTPIGTAASMPWCWRPWPRAAPCPPHAWPWRTSSAKWAPRATCRSGSA